MSSYDTLEPRAVWQIFGELSKVPRGSGDEAGVMAMLRDWGRQRDLDVRQDEVGNLLISIPATPGREHVAPILIQGHVDMVCEKNSGTKHDFAKDPIELLVDGDWVTADGTTLGADNGIGVSMGLALAEDHDFARGPVEVLLTVDEERGLTGAAGVQPDFFRSRRMINLDSEEDDALFVGCAGGRDSILTRTNTQARAPKAGAGRKVIVRGLLGGHSGLDIHKNRGNAIRILTRLLLAAGGEMDLRLVAFEGGSMRNAIPREAEARVVIPQNEGRRFKQIVDNAAARIQAEELAGIDDGLEVRVSTVQAPRCFSTGCTRQTLDLLAGLPNGVMAMSRSIPGLVESSNNVGVVRTSGAKVEIVCCSRSSIMSALDGLVMQISALGELAGARVEQPAGYPGWKPNLDSPLLAVARREYARAFGRDPELKAVHAGLECGLLTEKYPDLDIVSFGPDILGAHSPDEKVSIGSVQRIWKLFTGLISNLD